jgi:hypothetical protein
MYKRMVAAGGLVAWLALALPACGGGGGAAPACPEECAGTGPALDCQALTCDLATGQCVQVAVLNGTTCGEQAVCYGGACHAQCSDSAECQAAAPGELCVNRKLRADAEVGLCFASADLPCSAQAGCGDVLTGACTVAACDAQSGTCAVETAPDGEACAGTGTVSMCKDGICRGLCGDKSFYCPQDQVCVDSASTLPVCVPATTMTCTSAADCHDVLASTCHKPECVNGLCAVTAQPDGATCDAQGLCWDQHCVGWTQDCATDGACPPGQLCVQGQERASSFNATAGAGSVGGSSRVLGRAGSESPKLPVCVFQSELSCQVAQHCAQLVAPACSFATCQAYLCSVQPQLDGAACGAGQVCSAGACRAPCSQDQPACPEGTLCQSLASLPGQGACVPVACAGPAECQGLLVELDACHAVGCSLARNLCEVLALPDATPCDDGDLCNGVNHCQLGVCVKDVPPVECGPTPGPCQRLECQAGSGACLAVPDQDGQPCDDGQPCTSGTTCSQGACGGGEMTCQACDYDFDCAALDDGDRCNGLFLCLEGVCAFAPQTQVSCPPDDFCQTWECQPATGQCLPVPLVDPPVLAAQDFDDGTLEGFQVLANDGAPLIQASVSTLQADSPPNALYLGNPDTGDYASGGQPFDLVLQGEPVPLSGAVAPLVRLQVLADLDFALGDALRVLAHAPGSDPAQAGQLLLVADSTAPLPAAWQQVSGTLDATGWTALVLRVEWHSAGQGLGRQGVFLDSVEVLAQDCE